MVNGLYALAVFCFYFSDFHFFFFNSKFCLATLDEEVHVYGQEHKILAYEPVHEISNNVVCANSKDSDQPVHMLSLIRAFAHRLNIL